jgi:hypothetical protein
VAEDNNIRAIEFEAEIRQVKTMADHSINVTINLPENCEEQALMLARWRLLLVRCVVELKKCP